MVVPWQGAAVFVGLTGLPHPDLLHNAAKWLMSSLQINLPSSEAEQQARMQRLQSSSSAAAAQIDDFNAQLARFFVYILLALVAWVVLTVVAMCMYEKKVHEAKPKIGEGNTTMKQKDGNFHYGLFDCFSNMNECMCAFCCSSLRFADTHSAITGGGFWSAFCFFVTMNVLPAALIEMGVSAALVAQDEVAEQRNRNIAGWLGALVRGVIFGGWARGQLRKKLGDPTPSLPMKQLHDVVSWALFSCCALTQEAVEADIAADVVVSCPFTVVKGRAAVRAREVSPSDYEKMVGDAVLLEGR